jgi:hypothetical protein
MTTEPPQAATGRHDSSTFGTSSASPDPGALNMKDLSSGNGPTLLATMLADWGDAPRYDIPPLDCPLNLINP